ncbi:DUF58 domain-containing protein [Jonesia quinghaiensis]|uniref:DUF58 domain-containing protein n=1 Tax=Jonesia quinghaiensis TaxID=262806 RepID=UPI000427BD05|nr:DUF58 domain-containing protein [Jonesia quinghaiensis]
MQGGTWYRTSTREVLVVLAAISAVLAVLSARPLLMVVTVGLLLLVHERTGSRPQDPVDVSVETAPIAENEPENGKLTMRLTLKAPISSLAAVTVRYPGADDTSVVTAVQQDCSVSITVPMARTGIRDLGEIAVTTVSDDGLFMTEPMVHRPDRVMVLPQPEHLPHVPTSSSVRGLTGPHRSSKRGSGTEFHDVDVMQRGDRTSTINWRATARRSPDLDQLYVRRTDAQAESDIILMIDSRDDVGREIDLWGSGSAPRPDQRTSLDIARIAGSSLAKAHLDLGDRVGCDDLGRPRPPVPPSAGRRHMVRILYALAMASPYGAPQHRVRPPALPTGARVYLLTTCLDDVAPHMTAQLVSHGHDVIVIDTLPKLSTWGLTQRTQLGWRIVNIEREARLHTIRSLGVDIIAWDQEVPNERLAAIAHATRRTRR